MQDESTKERALAQADAAWLLVLEALAGATDEDLLRPDAAHGWSLAEIVSHLSAWEREATVAIPILAEGKQYEAIDEERIDQVNERFLAESRGKPAAQVRREALASHGGLMEMLHALRPEAYQGRALAWVAANTYDHYREHFPLR